MYVNDKGSHSICCRLLIALFERAVGFYASLININAYHQPGVEAGKKAAGNVIELQHQILKVVRFCRGSSLTHRIKNRQR